LKSFAFPLSIQMVYRNSNWYEHPVQLLYVDGKLFCRCTFAIFSQSRSPERFSPL